MVEWFKALDLKSGGPWFKSSTLPLSGFVLGSPISTPRPRCVNSQLVSLPPVGILNSLCYITIFVYLFTVSPISTVAKYIRHLNTVIIAFDQLRDQTTV